MSARSPYRPIEKAIAASDSGTAWNRWLYGRRLLCDPSATDRDGNLRPGKMAELIEAAARVGVKLAEAEILARLRAARAYPCESQVRAAIDCAGTWDVLVETGFQPHEAQPGEEPYDPRTAAEQLQQAERQLALGEPDQMTLFELFPSDRYTPLSTLGELAKFAAECAETTERFAARDRKRAEYLAALLDAAGGNESATWAEAQAALDVKAAAS